MVALSAIPPHLLEYVVEQDASLYTPMDHAAWRFILKISRRFFSEHAHPIYVSGLASTGISIDRIPTIEEIDSALHKFQWRAVAVSGFIPPAVFMEMLSLGILPIACDMRQIEHLAYTPAPDIVHEAAGHAPIIADAAYADYLRSYGEVSRKAIYSKHDVDLYLAIRELSSVKEDPASSAEDIARAEKKLDQTLAGMPADSEISEAAKLARMGWWTFEYGLIGDAAAPKIYGAGLLSSVSESYHCLNRDVKKVPFSIGCTDVGYDITKPQPQLFVARDFDELNDGLEELASRMAFRTGGSEAVRRALRAQEVTTLVLESGLQISGKLIEAIESGSGGLEFVKYAGPVQLAIGDAEIKNQGTSIHAEGYSAPLGRVRRGAEWISSAELTENDLRSGHLEFESGIVLTGKLTGLIPGILASYENCRVFSPARVFYEPEWGRFDLALGTRCVSAFGGPADRAKWPESIAAGKHRQKSNLTPENEILNGLFAEVRALRDELKKGQSSAGTKLPGILSRLSDSGDLASQNDWLLHFECLELFETYPALSAISDAKPWRARIENHLAEIAQESPDKKEIITRGLECLRNTAPK